MGEERREAEPGRGCKTDMQSILLGEVADYRGRAIAGWRGRVKG